MPPIVADDSFSVHGPTNLPNVFLNDTSPPGGGPFNNHTDVTQPSHGTIEGVAAGSFLYRPTFGYVGSDSFTYRGCVGLGNCSTNSATVTLDVVNSGPIASPDVFIVPPPGGFIVGNLLANDSDSDDPCNPVPGHAASLLHSTIHGWGQFMPILLNAVSNVSL
ncbi:MAG: Ig-like domain-containing protein [Acidobacteriota bacterium]